MYILRIIGPRGSTLARHHLDNRHDLDALCSVYRAMGYKPEALVVELPTAQAA
ncbi:MAG TPA: hypothetical protein VFB58_03600 [Chloroflexota bacterium]|nr:hypothetical protein [Chloroflexota bacterium]